MSEWYLRDLSRKQRTAIRVKGESGKPTTNCAIYGYRKDPNDKYHWRIDEEAAAVVRRIFQLTIEGHGPYEIATMLCEEKVETPATYFARQGRGVWKSREDIPRPYSWNGFAVGQILSKPEYMGHTVNFRSYKESYKDKRAVVHSPEDWLIFENTHEAIVDEELWNVVQKIRENRRRPTRTGEIALFSGLIFCAECGSHLNFHNAIDRGKRRHSYICSKYRNSRGKPGCEAHYIQEEILADLVLENLRNVISYARDYEDKFVQQVTDNTLAEQMKEQTLIKRQLEQQTRRISEIDTIIQRLYEDNISGKLSDERFSKMSATYEREQKGLEISTSELRIAVENCEQKKVNIKSFMKLVKSYTEPEQLTPEILRMFVEKVVVHAKDESNGRRVRRIDIYYNFVGQFDMSIATTKVGRWK